MDPLERECHAFQRSGSLRDIDINTCNFTGAHVLHEHTLLGVAGISKGPKQLLTLLYFFFFFCEVSDISILLLGRWENITPAGKVVTLERDINLGLFIIILIKITLASWYVCMLFPQRSSPAGHSTL